MSNTIKIVGGLIGLFALVSYSIGQYLAFALLMTVLAPLIYYTGIIERGVKTAYSKTVYALVTITIFSWSWMLAGQQLALPTIIPLALLIIWFSAIIIAAVLVVKKRYVEKSEERVEQYNKGDVFEVPLMKLAVYFFFVFIVGGMLLSFLTVAIYVVLGFGSEISKNISNIGLIEFWVMIAIALALTYRKSKVGFGAR